MLKLRFASRPSTAWVFWSTGFRIRLLYVNVKAEGRAILKPQIQRDQHCLINLLASQQEFIPSYLSIDPSTCLSTKTARSVYAILPVSVKGVLGFPGILPPPPSGKKAALLETPGYCLGLFCPISATGRPWPLEITGSG